MLAEELRKTSEEASRRVATTSSESFILFVRERATKTARYGQLSFSYRLDALPWSESEMNASFPALKEDGFNIQIEYTTNSHLEGIASMGLGTSRPRELKVSW